MMEEKKLMVVMEKIIVNGNESVFYNDNQNLSVILKDLYKDQGEFYEKELGISREDADMAGWMPECSKFDPEENDGWKRMLFAHGEIEKTCQKNQVSAKEAVFHKWSKYL